MRSSAQRPGALERIRRGQERANRNSLGHASLFEAHRRRLTDELRQLAPGGRLAVLGAGNCFDLDLPALAAHFDEIQLVDLDRAALERAIAREAPEVQARLVPRAPVDLSGVGAELGAWTARPPTRAALEARLGPASAALVAQLGGPFEAVASTCLVTQMSLQLTEVVGDVIAVEARRHVAALHLRTMAALLAPGGRGLLATDLVGNATYPLEELGPDADLTAVAQDLVRTGNFFHGADPLLYSRPLRQDAALVAALEPASPLSPWLWNQAPGRWFLVTGFSVRRR